MPKYIYKCLDCGCEFDLEATLKEKEEGKGEKFVCAKCGSKKIKHQFSPTSFIKGVFGGDQGGGCCSGQSGRGGCCG